MHREVDIPLARLVLAGPSLVEIHVKPDVKITVERIHEIVSTWRTLMGGAAGAMYFIAPGELDWESATLQADFFGNEGDKLTAIAVMVNAPILTTVVNLYFGLFPTRFPIRVVSDLEAGHLWLAKKGHLKEVSPQ